MNETIKNMIERRSIRKYTSEPVPQEIIDEIVEAGTYAATGRNAQSPIIIEVTNKELRDRLLMQRLWVKRKVLTHFMVQIQF